MPTDESRMSQPRYAGVPTFMRTPYQTDLTDLDIALIGIPYDGAVTNRAGARHGPRDIRDKSSMMRAIHHVTKVNPYALCNIADIGDATFEALFDHDAVVRDIESFFARVHKAGVVPLSAGGDHSVSYPILKAIAKDEPVGLIHIDAHTDTWDEFQGSKFMHGTPFRRAHEDGLIDASRTIQIGIRGAQNTSEGWDYSLAQGMRVVFMEEFTQMGVDAVIQEARRIVGDGPAYLTFDVDGLDPVYAPGTGTPEIGGITTIEAQALLRGLRHLNLIGADVVEVAPPFDPSGNTSLVGATLMYEMLCLLAEVIADKKAMK
ncbi:agmatinase [Leucothrix pacifica]|nr:agmatinase [Leucothrix pacifica]